MKTIGLFIAGMLAIGCGSAPGSVGEVSEPLLPLPAQYTADSPLFLSIPCVTGQKTATVTMPYDGITSAEIYKCDGISPAALCGPRPGELQFFPESGLLPIATATYTLSTVADGNGHTIDSCIGGHVEYQMPQDTYGYLIAAY